jgi:hypothetical protein
MNQSIDVGRNYRENNGSVTVESNINLNYSTIQSDTDSVSHLKTKAQMIQKQ